MDNKANKLLADGCDKGDQKLVEEALNQGAKPNAPIRLPLGEQLPLCVCAAKGSVSIAKILISKGADVHKKLDFDGTTCLHHAASNNQPKMIEFLVESGCDVNEKDKLQRTPLTDAAEIGSIDCIEVLITKGADINVEDKENNTPLSYVLDFVTKKERKPYDCALLLMRRGADVKFCGKFTNRSVLHCAASLGDLDTVKELVEKHKINPYVCDCDGKTAIEYANENKHEAIAQYLSSKQNQQAGNCCTML